jgi:DNA phosphorothioation-dependent restriction protein DptG
MYPVYKICCQEARSLFSLTDSYRSTRGNREIVQTTRTQCHQPWVDQRGPHGSDQVRVMGYAEGKLRSGPPERDMG